MIQANLVGIIWIIFLAYWWISATKAKKSAKIENQSQMQRTGFRILIIIIVFLLLQLPDVKTFFYHDFIASYAIKIVGLIFFIVGLALAVWARIYLGRNWGVPMSLREKHELITTGPYAWVRHPIYSGFLLAMLGSGLADSFIWLVIFIYLCIYFIYSAKVEEKMMAEIFPDQYPEYKKRTKMLIPFVL